MIGLNLAIKGDKAQTGFSACHSVMKV